MGIDNERNPCEVIIIDNRRRHESIWARRGDIMRVVGQNAKCCLTTCFLLAKTF